MGGYEPVAYLADRPPGAVVQTAALSEDISKLHTGGGGDCTPLIGTGSTYLAIKFYI